MGAALLYVRDGAARAAAKRLCSLVVFVLLAVACKRASAPAATKPAATGVDTRAASAAWLAGTLPANVTSGQPRRGGQLVVGVDVEPASLNPILQTDWIAKRMVQHRIYESLVRVDAGDDPEYRIAPQLAERWEVSEDGRRYTFHLRRGVRWHDGREFSSADVLATLDKLRDPHTLAASLRSDFAELESYAAPDPWTVVTQWSRPYFLVLDALTDLPIQPAHIIGSLSAAQYNEAATNPLNRAPIGTGPFKLARWESQSQIALERNAAYWGKPAYLDRLIFRIVPDATVRLQLAERGELQLVYLLKYDQWQHMDSAELRTHWNRSRFYSARYSWLGWNVERAFFADRRVRRAMTMLVDRPAIIEKLLYGLPRPTTCHFYWASAACAPDQKPLPYDPAAAAALLDECDIRDHDGDGLRDRAGVPFRFVVSLPSSAAEAAKVATKIQQDLSRAGIDMRIERVEWSAFLQRMTAHDFDAAMLSWGGDARMDPTQIWHSSSIDGGSNFIGYRNPRVDALIERARVTLDVAARDAMFRELGAILHDEQPYTFLYVPAELDLLHERVRGARANLFWWQFEDLWLAPESGEP